MTEPSDDPAVIRIVNEYGDQHSSYTRFAGTLERTIADVLAQTSFKIDAVTARAKDPQSVRQKVVRKGYADIQQLTDLCGVRIVCYYESEIGDIVEVLGREFDVIEDSAHGSGQPDTFGYVSRHLLVRLSASRLALPEWSRFETFVAEIQIRTVLQHAWAAISHSLAYKTADEVPDRTRRRLARVAALLETGDEIFDVYRTEVERLRASYRESAVTDDWAGLPVDLDSVAATWRRLELHDLAEEAAAHGWRRPFFPDIYESAEWPIGNMDRASRLTRVAVAAGVTSIGELLDECRAARSDRNWLDSVARSASEYVPFAIGPDVLGLALVSKYGEPVGRAALQGQYPYLGNLVELVEQSVRS